MGRLKLFKRKTRYVPDGVSQLTTEWVTAAMREVGEISADSRVKSFVPESLKGSGIAMTGELARLRLTYEPEGAGPATAIAKFASNDLATKGMLESYDAYAREIYFYRDLAPQTPLRTPRHLGSGLDSGRSKDRPGQAKLADALPARVQLALAADVSKFMKATKRRYALLIEDLSDDTVVFDAAHPPSADLLGVALEALARLHAAFWGQGESMSGQRALGHVFTRTPKLFANEVRLRTFELAQEHWSDWWTESDTMAVLTAVTRLTSDVDTVNEPLTLVHGDPRSDNILFSASQDGPPAFIDWSLPAMAHPGWDVSYLLGSSLDASNAQAADGLIDDYHRTLVEGGCDISSSALKAAVRAGWRAQAVLNVLSVRVLPEGTYGEAGALHDLWMPRILALLRPRAPKRDRSLTRLLADG